MPAPLAVSTTQNSQSRGAKSNSNARRPTVNGQPSSRNENGPVNGANIVDNPNKNVKHRSSKPIINWLQRKLAGTVRPRRVSEPSQMRARGLFQNETVRSPVGAARSQAAGNRERAVTLREVQTSPSPLARSFADENGAFIRGQGVSHRTLSNQISLNSTETGRSDYSGDRGGDDEEGAELESLQRSSGAGISLWSRSLPGEADDDASTRPLPPTSPPSPSPSRSSSSYLSDPRTFRSISLSTSTKPTTLLSIDLAYPGMAHIAQAPPTPTTTTGGGQGRFPNHVRTPSSGPGTSFTFSALPPSPQSSRPSSLNPVRANTTYHSALQAPSHTTYHPRNNPRPASPPLDNASVVTLASSAFGFSRHAWSLGGAGTIGTGVGGDSASHLGGGDSMSHIFGLEGEDKDVDASVRALRPRSHRRDSWESEVSHWSAGGPHVRSIMTAPSLRTGGPDGGEDTASVDVDMSEDRNSCDGTQDETDTGSKTEQDESMSQSPSQDHASEFDEIATPAARPLELDEEEPETPLPTSKRAGEDAVKTLDHIKV